MLTSKCFLLWGLVIIWGKRMFHKSSLDAKMYLSVDMYCLIKVVIQELELMPCVIPVTRVTLHLSVPSAL